MKNFVICFEYEGHLLQCCVDKFKDKGEPIYVVQLTNATLVNKFKASKISCCYSSIKKYYNERNVLSPLMIKIWNAIQEKENELSGKWLNLSAWFAAKT